MDTFWTYMEENGFRPPTKKVITLGLIVAVLATGCCKKNSSNQDNVQYFNPNPQVLESRQPPKPVEYKKISYDALVELVKQNSGSLEVNLSTVDIGKDKGHGIYQGFGYAWTNKMQGTLDSSILAELTATDVGKDKSHGIYQGFGYAWANKMQGTIGGNEFKLTTTKVGKDKVRHGVYQGIGYAWTQNQVGDLGDQLSVSIETTAVGKDKGHGIYQGFGYAWASQATMKISFRENAEH